jgi:hypothetical protein
MMPQKWLIDTIVPYMQKKATGSNLLHNSTILIATNGRFILPLLIDAIIVERTAVFPTEHRGTGAEGHPAEESRRSRKRL